MGLIFTRTSWYNVEDGFTLRVVEGLDVSIDDSVFALGRRLRDEKHSFLVLRHRHHLLVVRLARVGHVTDVVVHAAIGGFNLKQVKLNGTSYMVDLIVALLTSPDCGRNIHVFVPEVHSRHQKIWHHRYEISYLYGDAIVSYTYLAVLVANNCYISCDARRTLIAWVDDVWCCKRNVKCFKIFTRRK